MTEPIPPAETPPPPQPNQSKCNWHRVRVYAYSIVLMLTMWFCATLLTIRLHPERIVHAIFAQLPYSSSTGEINWLNRRTLVINDVKIGGFFYADTIVVTASPFGLFRHHIAKVEIVGGQLFTKPLYEAMDQQSASNSDGLDWVIGRLELARGTVMLDNLIESTSIPVRVGVRHPIVLTALRLGKPDSSPEMSQERELEIGQVNIVSPVDPTTPVFSFPLTKLTFTYNEFWHHQIRAIEMVRPTIYLGQDLFWLTKELKSEHQPRAVTGPSAPWSVGRFEVTFGRLAVNAFGQPIVHLPFFFNTEVKDIRLDQLDQISAKSTVNILDLTQDYPDYKINIKHLTGKLYFSWPPSDTNANNVVNTISIQSISWNNIAVKNVDGTVTFDPSGIYGKLTNGTCEGGSLNGNFEFYYAKGFTWNADFFATKINCQPIAEKLAGKYINLTGELDGKVAVQGQSTTILNCNGSLNLPNPGALKIKSMDDLVNRIPADMIKMKRDAIKLAIGAFQDYPYDYGILSIDYKPTGGMGLLKLDGPRGGRKFEIYLHPFGAAEDTASAH